MLQKVNTNTWKEEFIKNYYLKKKFVKTTTEPIIIVTGGVTPKGTSKTNTEYLAIYEM